MIQNGTIDPTVAALDRLSATIDRMVAESVAKAIGSLESTATGVVVEGEGPPKPDVRTDPWGRVMPVGVYRLGDGVPNPGYSVQSWWAGHKISVTVPDDDDPEVAYYLAIASIMWLDNIRESAVQPGHLYGLAASLLCADTEIDATMRVAMDLKPPTRQITPPSSLDHAERMVAGVLRILRSMGTE